MAIQNTNQNYAPSNLQTQSPGFNPFPQLQNIQAGVSSSAQGGVQTQNNNQKVDSDQETFEFIDILVQAIIGYPVESIAQENRLEIVGDCVKLFSNYIIEFVEQKYGLKDAIRLKAGQQFAGQNVFSKFAELGSKFDEAYMSFVEELQKDLALQK